MARIIDVLPELAGEEMIYVQNLIKDMTDDQARTFASVYRTGGKNRSLF